MRRLLDQPAGWRATSEMERLRAALNLRHHVNAHYLGAEGLAIPPLRIRTLESLVTDIERAREAS
jgi:hypothetical protein